VSAEEQEQVKEKMKEFFKTNQWREDGQQIAYWNHCLLNRRRDKYNDALLAKTLDDSFLTGAWLSGKKPPHFGEAPAAAAAAAAAMAAAALPHAQAQPAVQQQVAQQQVAQQQVAPVTPQNALPLPHVMSQDDVGLLEWASEMVVLATCTAEVIPSEWSRLQVLLDGDPPTPKQKSLIKSIRRFKGCVEKKELDATKVVRALAQIADAM